MPWTDSHDPGRRGDRSARDDACCGDRRAGKEQCDARAPGRHWRLRGWHVPDL